MISFDYNIHAVIGTLSINTSSGHGYIKVYGFSDGRLFHRLSEKEAEEFFTPNGEVFAAHIQRDYYGMDNSIVSIYVMPNTKEGGRNAFVWDKSDGVESAGARISKVEGHFVDDGNVNFDILKRYDLLNKDRDVYILSDDKLYYIDKESDSRLIPYCKYSNDLPTINRQGTLFYVGSGLEHIDGAIDITTDEQLVEWFLRTAKINWDDIQKGSGKLSLRAAKDALLMMKSLPSNVVESRIRRLNSMTEAYVLTRDNLHDIASTTWFKASLDNALVAFKDQYIETIIKDYKDEIEAIRSEHDRTMNEENSKFEHEISELLLRKEEKEKEIKSELNDVIKDIDNSRNELNSIKSDIASAETMLSESLENLTRIEERKKSIIEDFQVIKDVLKISGTDKSNNNENKRPKTDLRFNSLTERLLPFYKGFENNLESCLKGYKVSVKSVSEMSNAHAKYKVLVVPNIQIGTAMICAAGKSWSYTIFVSVAWKSFDDLWNSGLEDVVKHCSDEPNIIHYAVLRNINLSCLSNYLQPIADLIGGFIDTFPNTDITFPDNLRIIMTAAEEELLPMPESILRYFGCISKDVKVSSWETVPFSNNNVIGYIDTKLLSSASEEITEVENHYQDYIDE